jgi:hypothetical protein
MTPLDAGVSQAPDDPARIIRPAGRATNSAWPSASSPEMQTQLQATLGEQKHLADLGLAVSKINHDMRNILASAQLISDRLAQVKDPAVQAFAPKLVRALDRAVSYSEGVLAYGRTQEAPPAPRVGCAQLVEEVRPARHRYGAGSNSSTPSTRLRDRRRRRAVFTGCCPISRRNAVQAMAATRRSPWCAA